GQCGPPPRCSGIPSDDGSMARGSIRPTPRAGEVGGQPDPAGLCARQACRYDRYSGRDACRRPEGCVEGASGRASAEPTLGNGVESGTDFSPSSARLSRGWEDADQPRGDLPGTLRARPRSATPRTDGLFAYGTGASDAKGAYAQAGQKLRFSRDY